jgi:hypothetical protein
MAAPAGVTECLERLFRHSGQALRRAKRIAQVAAVTWMQAGASARAIVTDEYVHPTFSEGALLLVMKIKQYSLA